MVRNAEALQSDGKQPAKDSVSSSAFGSSDGVAEQAIQYIDQHLNDPLMTIEQVALPLHLSPRHLARLFQSHTGMPIMTFVTRRRMELASRFLIETSFSVGQIAMYSGYISVPSFIKAFIRHFEMSPAKYRAGSGQLSPLDSS